MNFKNQNIRNIKKSSLIVASVVGLCGLTTNVTAGTYRDFSPSLSKDSKQFVYYSYRGQALPDLYINSADGSSERKLTNSKDLWEIEPDWSASSNKIAYSAGENMGSMEIFITDPIGTSHKQLTDSIGSSTGPNFSPDGQFVVFNRMFRKTNQSMIVKVNIATGIETPLTDPDEMSGFKPKFSPDGKTVAFLGSKDKGQTNDIFLMDANGDNIRVALKTDIKESMLAWMPSGNELIVSGNKALDNSAIYRLNLNKKQLSKISTNDDDNFFFVDVSDDGKTLSYDSGDWTTQFYIYSQPITSDNISGAKNQLAQVSGLQYVAAQKKLLDDYLQPFVGNWIGESTEGFDKGHFREEASYQWGPHKKSLDVSMKFYWDDEPMGTARGNMSLDRDNQQVYFNLVMEDGTVVMQKQSNTGNGQHFKMDVTSSGDGQRFPLEFKTEFKKLTSNQWESTIFRKNKDEWTKTGTHLFKRK